MSYNRKQFDKQKLKKLASKCSSWIGGGSYYDERKGRYIRYYKSRGRRSLYATYKRIARKKSRLRLKKHDVYTKKAEDLWWKVW